MAQAPGASQRLDPTGGSGANGTDYIVVIAAVPLHADAKPRVYVNPASIYAYHGFSEGLRYAAIHLDETKKPVLFCGIPIITPGAIGRIDTSGNSGGSVCSMSAVGDGPYAEADIVVSVITGGTVGTSQIVLGLSCDGGRTTRPVRLGTATSYTIPYYGLALSLTTSTLVAGDVIYRAHTTAPKGDSTGLASARAALKAQQKLARSWLYAQDLSLKTDADYVLAQINGYETSDNRFCQAQCQLRDRLPYAQLSHELVRMNGAPNVTFTEVGAGNDTAVRSAGSFVTDGFHTGGFVRITGAVASTGHNNIEGVATVTNATTLTFPAEADDFVNEGPIAGVSMTCEPTITFVDGGGSADSVTRSKGSWLDDGFRDGDVITFAGTVSNNHSYTAVTVSASTITFATGTVTAEVVGSGDVTATAGETKAAWIAALDTVFEDIDDEPRINLAVGRAYKRDPFTQWEHALPIAWADSVRSYQHDYNIATWDRSLPPLSGWDLNDLEGNLVQYDDRVDGGALAARFTCATTLDNGNGTYIQRSLTRAVDGAVLANESTMRVCNLLMTVNQQTTGRWPGRNMVLQSDGTATPAALGKLKDAADAALLNALRDHGEGQRASSATWTPATDDILNVEDADLHGVLNITFNGLLVQIDTTVRVNQGA